MSAMSRSAAPRAGCGKRRAPAKAGLQAGVVASVLAALSLPVSAAGSSAQNAAAPAAAVYPGAKFDPAASEFVRTSLGEDGQAYRTGDSVGKVAAFYRKLPGAKPMGEATQESAAFGAGCKQEFNAFLKKTISVGCAVHITVQNPWMDTRTGKLSSDTLITIVKKR